MTDKNKERLRKAGLLPPKELEKLSRKGLNFIKYEIIRRDGIINMGDVLAMVKFGVY